MKIRVVTIKDICKYLVRFGIVFAVIVIFTNFFYSNRNITSCVSLDSAKFLGIIKEEILLLKNESEINLGLFSKKDYSKETVSGEINMFKAVADKNLENTVLVNNEENSGTNNNSDNNQNSNNQNTNTQDENGINNENNSENIGSNIQNTGFNSNSELQEARNRFTC